MKVKILDLLEKDSKFYVKIKSEYGTILGEWKDEKPKLNKEYYIEFTVTSPVEINKNLFISNDYSYYIKMQDEKIILNGKYDSLDDDGCLTIRIGESIILLDYSNYKDSHFLGDCYLTIILSYIQIFDTYLI
jgi:hypothetical protein